MSSVFLKFRMFEISWSGSSELRGQGSMLECHWLYGMIKRYTVCE